MTILKSMSFAAALACGAATLSLTPATASSAHSAPRPDQSSVIPNAPTFTPDQLEEAFREFDATGLQREYSDVDGSRRATFHLPQGVLLTLTDPEEVTPAPVDPHARLGVGRTSSGYWFSFNQFDQNTLSNVVIAGALTAAICAIPGVGAVACALAGAVVSVGVSCVHKHGVCSNNRQLYWYDVRGGSVIECRTSAPR
ncbi:hypothetical protein GCM10025780_32850 [Frondihabitans cladoniiphilus]|uniref:Secreted protein n=1 Tax=Frondihabitans cladoniiphilus TaxID=715785 RepID=A0ABP8W9S2_9MICO